MVGREGIVGTTALLGGGPISNRLVVQVKGQAQVMPLHILQEEFQRGGRLQEMVLRHLQLILTDTAQSALCNRLHTVEQRLCRWLLTAHDRTHSDALSLTHEFIANMLGTRRAGVTQAIGALEGADLIRHSRGCITILDPDGMEQMACECYGVVREQFEYLIREVSWHHGITVAGRP